VVCRFCKNKFDSASSHFCSNCGEKKSVGRIGVRSLIETVGDDFFGFEKGFLYTLYSLIKSPALVVKSYLHGARKEFHSPVKLYAVVLFLSITVFSSTGNFVVAYEDGLGMGFSNQISVKSTIKADGDKDTDQEKVQILMKHLEKNFKTYLQFFFFSWVPISALFLWLFFSYRGFTFGETLAVSAYFAAVTLLLSTLNELVTFAFPGRLDKGYGVVEALGFVFYYYLIRKLYYRKGRKFHIRVLGFTLMSLVFYIALIGGLVVWSVKTQL